MSAQNISRFIDIIAFTRNFPVFMIHDKIRIIAVRHEADFLRVRLRSHPEPRFPGDPPDFFFGVVSKRHQGPCQLLLRQAAEHVSLVLSGMSCLPDRVSSVFKLNHGCIVARCHIISFEDIRMIDEALPFYFPVAHDTGIWRHAVKIIPDKWLYNLLFKIGYAVKGVIRNPNTARRLPGVINFTAAAFLPFRTGPGAQGDAHHLISGLFEQAGRHRTVHSS